MTPRPSTDMDVAVLYLPGNAGNRSRRTEIAQALADQGFTVLLVDYRGYGGNPGTPSEEGLALDARAAASWLRDNGHPAERTIYVGESIGTGVAATLATTDTPAGLLLRSPYTSLADVARDASWIPVGLLLKDRFDTLERMPSITAPTTVLAGDSDTLIPVEQSTEVARAAANLNDLVVIPDAGHNDPRWFGPILAEHTVSLASKAIPHLQVH